MESNKDIYLPSLTIKGFRGIKDLTIPRLGKATLLAGMNGAGKTTVLDAVRVFASRGSYPVLADMLQKRDETSVFTDEDGESQLGPNWSALFHGRILDSDSAISIGPADSEYQVAIRTQPSIQLELPTYQDASLEDDAISIETSFNGYKREYPTNLSDRQIRRMDYLRRRVATSRDPEEMPASLICESLGPGIPSSSDLDRFWDDVALTDEERRTVKALRLIYGDMIERVAFIGENSRSRLRVNRRAMVKVNGEARPVPLMSLGDGAVRVLGVALALASSRGGFLLLDEVENGIHHSIQRDFWEMVLRTAHENNVQVIATTHSNDCVKGFAHAAMALDGVVGLLHRIENDEIKARIVSYSEDGLKTAAEQGIEVR